MARTTRKRNKSQVELLIPSPAYLARSPLRSHSARTISFVWSRSSRFVFICILPRRVPPCMCVCVFYPISLFESVSPHVLSPCLFPSLMPYPFINIDHQLNISPHHTSLHFTPHPIPRHETRHLIHNAQPPQTQTLTTCTSSFFYPPVTISISYHTSPH